MQPCCAFSLSVHNLDWFSSACILGDHYRWPHSLSLPSMPHAFLQRNADGHLSNTGTRIFVNTTGSRCSVLGPGGPSSMPVTGSSAAFRAALWTSMDRLVDHVCQACSQIQQLEQVLAKKKDPVTHSSFLQELQKVFFSSLCSTIPIGKTTLTCRPVSERPRQHSWFFLVVRCPNPLRRAFQSCFR